MNVYVNKSSTLYENRYVNDIYGEYTLNIIASSNESVSKTVTIYFEQTTINTAVVDNYTRLKDATMSNGLPSSTDVAFPGESGLLAITLNPEDCDFDYILIENDDNNYVQGYASANFGLLARKSVNTSTQETDNSNDYIFDDINISGAVTAKGLKIKFSDIKAVYNKAVYNKTDNKNESKYINYNGIVYIKYDMGSYNVINGTKSKINVSIVKDNYVFNISKTLTINLQNYVAVEIEGKEGSFNQNNYYATYNVARGLKYKLNVKSYGYLSSNISISVDKIKTSS